MLLCSCGRSFICATVGQNSELWDHLTYALAAYKSQLAFYLYYYSGPGVRAVPGIILPVLWPLIFCQGCLWNKDDICEVAADNENSEMLNYWWMMSQDP